ncbi:MAG: hypothetical protein AB1609_17115 [Bacillota bacterium]
MARVLHVAVRDVVVDPDWAHTIHECDDEMTLAEFLELILPGLHGEVSLVQHYGVAAHDARFWEERKLPFVISRGHVRWFTTYDLVTMRDLSQTLGLDGTPLYIEYGRPWAGGPGGLPIEEAWKRFYSLLEYYGPLVTFVGFLYEFIGAFGRYLRARRRLHAGHPGSEAGGGTLPFPARLGRERTGRVKVIRWFQDFEHISPLAVVELIVRTPRWEVRELAQLLDATPARAAEYLRVLGYRPKRGGAYYIRTWRTPRLMRRLRRETWHA